MWKRIRKFGILRILAIMVLIALCIFVQLPYRQEVAESSAEGVVSEENTGNLGRGSRARQRFYFKKTVNLHNVDLRFDMQDKTANTEFLTVYIRDKEMNEIAKKRVYTKDMKDGEMTRVYFKGGVEIQGCKSYYLIVTGPELDEDEVSPAVRLASFSSPNKRLYVGGSLVKNQTLDVVYNYKYDDSFNALGMYIAGVLMIILLVVPRKIWQAFGRNKGLGWALFFVNPTIVLELTLHFYELTTGRLPAMKWYTYLLLLLLQMVAYAIISNKYITLLVLNTIAFLLAIANLQVSMFKGVPLMPADFLFLKTAADVSDNYTITWTHTQIHFMLFMFVYMVFIFFLGTYRRKEKSAGRKWRLFGKKAAQTAAGLEQEDCEQSETQTPVAEAQADQVTAETVDSANLKETADSANLKETAASEETADSVSLKETAASEENADSANLKETAASEETADTVSLKETSTNEENADNANLKETAASEEQTAGDNQQDVSKQNANKHRLRTVWKVTKIIYRLAFLAIGVYGIHYLYTTTVLADNELKVDIWNRNKSYKRNGIFLDFFMNFHYLNMEKPEGYSQEKVKEIVDKTTDEVTQEQNSMTGSKDPNIVIIMNESLADYTLLNNGNVMTYNKDYLPYIHSMEDNVIKGKCYVSVFGGQTANSEFECLTANSLAFFPSASVPYQQFVKGTTFSLPIYLESLGYKTTAIHPCVGTNWNRDVVYETMGFDKFYTQNDFTNPEYVRYISDEENYNKIIKEFENKDKDDKLFIMNVTMQNHGGYTDATEWEDPIVAGDGSCALANEYLSSAHVSDKAYKRLIQYFEDYEEPTIILMFGDHQPSIDETFINEVLGGAQDTLDLTQMQEKYCTPYVLWANYDIEENLDGVTSTNFLSNLVLENAGLPLAKYNQFVAGVQEDVKAMNAFGYMTNDGVWHDYEEQTKVTEKLKDYNIVEYGYFSDKEKEKMADIFSLTLPEE